jgi:hypothetical protein
VGPSSREKSELKLVVVIVTAKLAKLTSKDVKPTISYLDSETPCFGTETETFVEI